MARKKTDEEKEYAVLKANMRELLKTRAGSEVLWRILSFCNLYTDAFTGDNRTYYLEGKRSVGLDILQLMEDADPTAYARLLLAKQNQGDNDANDDD